MARSLEDTYERDGRFKEVEGIPLINRLYKGSVAKSPGPDDHQKLPPSPGVPLIASGQPENRMSFRKKAACIVDRAWLQVSLVMNTLEEKSRVSACMPSAWKKKEEEMVSTIVKRGKRTTYHAS
ncbi:hypothetical protein BKA70DRAFT_1226244 [Coprinopsis sp. MPI-PUGE-AT-0042]|nr:hypothetical protein BKA70DRAFT_1229715 [Coprinopsis sp. MPI-PUGE-AT-0042]KAH6905050.1 hypothetical protein BKA70DRAFT_1226244 [Coprinopsis sp. MPI-PUGE-AT-0042]